MKTIILQIIFWKQDHYMAGFFIKKDITNKR